MGVSAPACPRRHALRHGIFLTGVGAVLSYYGHYGFAAIPLAGAALHFAIASLDMTAARFVPNRT
jgi:hypothetical protein